IMGSFVDREGNVWFAHNMANGVSRYNPYGINLIRDLPVLHVNCITNDKSGNMWLSTDRGIFKYDGKNFTEPIPESRRVIGYTAKILADSKNNLWFATAYTVYLKDVRENVFITERGLLKFDGKRLTRFTTLDGMLSNAITDVIEDKKGNIWIAYGSGAWGKEYGVNKYDGKTFTKFTTAEGLPSNDVNCLEEDHEGNIWIGTWGSGLCKYDGKKFTTFTKDDGLVNDSITRILEDSKGQIWVGTGEGLSKYDGKSFTNINELSGKYVSYIIEDHKGYLWLSISDEGIVKTDGKTFVWITEDDGVPNPQFMNMLYEDKQGNIWIGSLGLSKYIPNSVPPIALIKSVTADQVYNEPKEISLPSGTKSFRVDFHGLSYRTRPEAMQYLYRLKGYDKDWQGPTKKASVDYLSITPGKYEFLVKAIDMDLNYSEPASMEVKIEHPPVYTRAGFIGGSIFLAFLIPSIIYAYLLTRQRRKQPFEPITSPYMVGGPIRNKDMFFGREEDFVFVNNRLKAEKEGITIVFFGQRRSGKTSLLHQILNGRLGENFMPVLIDMQEMPVNNDKEFFQKIADEISFGLSGTLEIDSYKYDFNSENPALVFEKFIDDVMAKSSGKTLLLMFDEYEILEEKMNEGIIKGTVPTFMAGI
ncbi:hypothetical protein FJZ33_10185, partial [Candidatus Poribacteria bacterium]|nr:hypothetical protein [Candidatus Poribacteria bacterium]